MLAVLELSDFFWIAVIVSLLAGGSTVYSSFKNAEARRLRRIEGKLDLILNELNLKYDDGSPLSETVKKLADDPNQKIAAIKLYRDETGAGLTEAKEAIEAYMAGRG